MALPAGPGTMERSSRYGAGRVYYPAEEERVVPLSARERAKVKRELAEAPAPYVARRRKLLEDRGQV